MPPKGRTNPKTGKPWTAAQDDAADRKAGIPQGSKRDNALDRKRGVPIIVVAIKPRTKTKR
jgi:hypothetical protein